MNTLHRLVTMHSGILLLASVLFCTGCGETDEGLSSDDSKKIVTEAKETLNRYFEEVNRDGLLAELKYLDSSADFYWVPPGYVGAISYDSVSKSLHANAQSRQYIVNNWESLRVTPLTPMYARYNGIIRSLTSDTSGDRTLLRMIETGLLVKRKDGWKMLSGQTSLIPE